MRSDYGLYGIAIICFVIAGIFMAGVSPGYTLMEQSGIAVIMVFLLLGVVFAAAGYTTRPKAVMPTTQPTPTPITPPRETLTQPIVEETPPPPPPSPAIQEEVQPEPEPPAQPEPSPPTAPVSMEAEQPVAAEEEKPKPVRRRRKKATA